MLVTFAATSTFAVATVVVATVHRDDERQFSAAASASRANDLTVETALVAGALLVLVLTGVAAILARRRRRAEHHADAADSALEAAFAATPDRWALFDDELRFRRVHDDPGDEILGRRVEEVVPPTVAASIRRSVASIHDGDGDATFEWSDAEGRTYESKVTPVPGGGYFVVARDVTEHRRLLDEVRRSETRFREMADHAPLGVFRTDGGGRNTYVNDAWLEICGIERSDAMGGTWRTLIHPDDAASLAAAWAQSIEDGGRVDIRFRIRRPDGGVRWVRSVATPSHGERGALLGSLIDMTEAHEATRAMTRSEQHFRSVVETANDGVVVVTADGTVAHASRRARELIGVDSLEGAALGDLLTAHTTVGGPELSEVIRSGTAARVELTMGAPDGGPTALLATTSASDGEGSHRILVLTDLTEIRRSAEALEASEARTREIVEKAPDAIVLIDADGLVESINRAAEQMYGQRSTEVEGRPVWLLLRPHDRPSHITREWLLDPALGAADRDGTLWGLRSDGVPFPVELGATELTAAGRTGYAWSIRDLTIQMAYEHELENLALHDSLTGLANRALFLDHLQHAFGRAERSGSMVAALLLDLDRFKIVNDSLGHDVGDELIRTIAHRLEKVVRDSDVVARLGGDEFAVCAEGIASIAGVTDLANRVFAALEEPVELRGHEVFVTASIGIALWTGSDESPADLLRWADAALHRAKDRGRDCFELYDETMQAWATARLDYDSALRRAVERGEFVVAYQPIEHLQRTGTAKFEALVRWDRGANGLVSPSEFIPLAEETGLIVELGAFVLDRACRDCAEWQDVAPGVGVTVNVSARQLDVTLVARVADALRRHRLTPGLLTLEITESSLMRDAPTAMELLHELRDLGVDLALDDFGTGYSSLTYLREFPMQVLKVDQSFVRRIDDPGTRMIVDAVIHLAQGLGLTVVAEGIETEHDRAVLAALDCDFGQGYLWSPPMRLDEARAYLTADASPTITAA